MTTLVHSFDWPDRVVIGTVGRPGSRTFYLQARAGDRTTSVAMEKQQSAVLAGMIDRLLDGLAEADGQLSIPAEAPVELVDDGPLDQPVEEDFRAGSMRLGWDPRTAQLVIEAFPVGEEPIDADDADGVGVDAEDAAPSEMLLLRIPVGTARAFAERARRVVAAGRPACPLCGMPVDSDGHECAPGSGD
ncbi:putative repeat protein (TIGR03847 family) [Isoptericola jiangsuensis]|uniref:Putative repeat protein (TIGR03847 family) n=1 Tax=Isoptericola jiangsuensis TaxID=548579 RepID=A0A2A9EZQ9_9MICO|nr:DUF3090 domain-containing protein [Isoptericola jiangsuensis]PFG43750.1 putative repeat protein (TIGR03847 family) [Isoptericola jiangsuensis]